MLGNVVDTDVELLIVVSCGYTTSRKAKESPLDGSTSSQSNLGQNFALCSKTSCLCCPRLWRTACSSVVSQQQVSGRLQHLVADQDVDPVRLLPVDVGDLLRGDAVERGDLLTQVQQRRLLQVHSSVDCGGGRRETGKHQRGPQVGASVVFPQGQDQTL